MVWRVSLFWAPQDENTCVLMNLGPRMGSYWLMLDTTLKNREGLSIFFSFWPNMPSLFPPTLASELPNLHRWCFAPVLGGGNWGSWNHWSLCSKTCDSGWQRRFRMCEGTGVTGYPCDGSGEEVRSCNEKKCPGQSLWGWCVCVSWGKGERVEKTESVLFFKCIIHAWKDCINTFCLGRFFFLLCGCISLHASPRGSLTETKECVVSVCATDLHMHSVCQADWKWFPVVRTTAKGLYCDFRTAPVSSLSVSGPPVNSHTHPSSPPHWFFHIPASRCLFILHLPERYSMWRSSLALFLSR